MSQVLHIFKKDARHLWPEVLASLVLTGIFAKVYPHTWAHEYQTSRLPDIVANVVTALVPISWWLMVTRLVHAESLVGERQFWITRPYQWQKLLASKFLFLAIFLYLPLLIAYCLLLREAGFHPSSYLPGLFYSLILITLILIVPIMAIATVTSGFAKAVLSLLAVIVYIVGLAALSSVWNASNPDTFGDSIVFFVLCSLGIAAIVVQYSNRNVRLSRWLVITIAIVFGLSVIPWAPLVGIEYRPSPAATPSVQLKFESNPSSPVAAYGGRGEKDVALRFPLAVSGVAAGTAVRREAVKVSIIAPNGPRWSSFWQYDGQYLTPGNTTSTVGVSVDRAFLEKIKDIPVSVQFTWAATRIRAGVTRQATMQTDEFAIPDGGICSLQSNNYSSSTQCRFPMREPRLTNFTTLWSHMPCSQRRSPDNTFVPLSGWMGKLDDMPADFGITSVWTSSLYFPGQGFATLETPSDRTYLCSGTPISFTEYTLIDRVQIDLVIPAIRLPYKSEDFSMKFNP